MSKKITDQWTDKEIHAEMRLLMGLTKFTDANYNPLTDHEDFFATAEHLNWGEEQTARFFENLTGLPQEAQTEQHLKEKFVKLCTLPLRDLCFAMIRVERQASTD